MDSDSADMKGLGAYTIGVALMVRGGLVSRKTKYRYDDHRFILYVDFPSAGKEIVYLPVPHRCV